MTTTPRLDDEQIAGIVAMLGDVDSVELKLTIPDAERRGTVESLGVDPLDAYLRQVYFFDTPDLRLSDAGLVVRLRRSQGRGDDSVVKLRPVEPASIDGAWREREGFKVEVDASPEGYVCSASFRRDLKPGRVRSAILGEAPISKAFSKQQLAFYEQFAPANLALDDLDRLGPITVLKLKQNPPGVGRKIVLELWFYPDGSRMLELSTKSAPADAFEAAARLRSYLTERGIDLGGAQEAKTRAALKFFSAER